MQIAAPGESGFVLGVFQSLEKNLVRNQQKADAIEQKKVRKSCLLFCFFRIPFRHGIETTLLQLS